MDRVKLGDVAHIQTGPFGSQLHKSDYRQNGIPVIMPQNIGDRTLILEGIACVSEEDANRLSRHKTQPNDIVYARRGDVEKHAFIDNDTAGSLCGTGCLLVRPDTGKVNPTFLSFLLNHQKSRSWVSLHAVGSNMPNINTDILSGLPLELPGRPLQDATASILSTIDNKIANNKKLMTELEETARLIYDYWFTQFDFPDENGNPYRSSGGAMVYNETLHREIPEGWNVGNLYNLADFINGLACQKFRPKNGDPGVPVIKIREMHDGVTADTELVASDIPDRNRVIAGDLLFAWSASLEVMFYLGRSGGLNQHIFKVIPKNGFCPDYVYQQLSRYIAHFRKMAEARKTTMGHVTADHLRQSDVPLPSPVVMEQYDCITKQIREHYVSLGRENRELVALRDWLLPMLMNGQVAVDCSVGDD